jgi:glucose-6-phosphate dehydrogenase assembly protein OpcA
MATTVVAQLWRESTPKTIELDLAALWRDIARETTVPVARAVMSNLVVVSELSGEALPYEQLAERLPLNDVVAHHPSRVILIELERGRSALRAPLDAGVGIVTFGPPKARYAVEEIGVRSACANQSLPSIVRRLIRGDMPTSLWWTGDLSKSAPPLELVTMGQQLVYDSSDWLDISHGVKQLAPYLEPRAKRIHLADLNWRRLASLRLALARAADLSGSLDWSRDDLRIAYRPGEGALAWLLAGWLGARLEWHGETLPRLEEADLAGEILSITIGGSRRTVVDLNPHRVLLSHEHGAPITYAVRREDRAEAVATELRTPSQNGALREAIAYLIRLFARH